jgi:hypothetical protein
MTDNTVPANAPASDQLHPVIYKGLIGLALVFVLSAWGFFAHGGYLGITLAVVSGLFLVAVALPGVL